MDLFKAGQREKRNMTARRFPLRLGPSQNSPPALLSATTTASNSHMYILRMSPAGDQIAANIANLPSVVRRGE
jgi:hypothetical protein